MPLPIYHLLLMMFWYVKILEALAPKNLHPISSPKAEDALAMSNTPVKIKYNNITVKSVAILSIQIMLELVEIFVVNLPSPLTKFII
jgi:hypothetical protein